MRPIILAATLLAVPLLSQTPPPDPALGVATAPIPTPPVIGDALHPAIAVVPLRGQAAQGFGDPSDAVYQRVTASIFKTRRFTMIERAQLGAVLSEGKNQGTTAFDDASAVTLGKQVGAKIVVIGSYTTSMVREMGSYRNKDGSTENYEFFPATVTVNLRLVNVETGRIDDVIDAKGSSKEPNPTKGVSVVMDDLAKKMDREVSNHFPLTGYVIQVLDEKQAMIDLGKAEGVAEGDQFLVFERGADIIHPVSGKVIKGAKKEITEFKVVKVEDDSSTVRISGSKVPIKPGMALESKPKKRGFFEALNDTVMK